MALSGRASLAVVLLLLVSVGPASAECAWVLWQGSHTLNIRGEWLRLESFDARAGCVKGSRSEGRR